MKSPVLYAPHALPGEPILRESRWTRRAFIKEMGQLGTGLWFAFQACGMPEPSGEHSPLETSMAPVLPPNTQEMGEPGLAYPWLGVWSSACLPPETGGEKNVATIVQAMHLRQHAVHPIARCQPIAAYYRSMDVGVIDVSNVQIERSALPMFQHLADRIAHLVDRPAKSSRADMADVMLEAMGLIDQAEQGDGLDMVAIASYRPHDWAFASLASAVQLRKVFERRGYPQRLFCDPEYFALQGLLALSHTSSLVTWYVQLTHPTGLDKFLQMHCDTIITCGQGVTSQRFGTPQVHHSAPIVTIPNGVDTQLYRPTQQLRSSTPWFGKETDHRYVIFSIGTLCSRKRQHLLLEALALLESKLTQRIDVYLFGQLDPSYGTLLSASIQSLTDRVQVHQMGWTSSVASWLPFADLVVHPSQLEGMPLALCEALACGVPCVASAIPGCDEIAVHAKGSDAHIMTLVDVDEVESWAAAIWRHVQMPLKERRHLKVRCREYAVRHLSQEKMLQRFEMTLFPDAPT